MSDSTHSGRDPARKRRPLWREAAFGAVGGALFIVIVSGDWPEPWWMLVAVVLFVSGILFPFSLVFGWVNRRVDDRRTAAQASDTSFDAGGVLRPGRRGRLGILKIEGGSVLVESLVFGRTKWEAPLQSIALVDSMPLRGWERLRIRPSAHVWSAIGSDGPLRFVLKNGDDAAAFGVAFRRAISQPRGARQVWR